MDAIIQSRLDRVDNALSTLIDSIASYIPSVPAATDLLVADDQLSECVDQCKVFTVDCEPFKTDIDEVNIHQANYARILRLRETVDSLNQSITANISSLADLRKELLTTPATVFSKDQRNVPYTELLDYAGRINKYTVPPTLRQPIPVPQAPNTTPSQPANTSATNGNGVFAEQNNRTPTKWSPNAQAQGEGIGVSSLDQKEVQWLDPMSTQVPFVPWPSEDVIRRGALAQIQLMMEQGKDPGGISATAAEDETEPPNGDAMIADQRHGEVKAVGAHSGESRTETQNPVRRFERIVEEKPKVFGGLDLYDPEEEG